MRLFDKPDFMYRIEAQRDKKSEVENPFKKSRAGKGRTKYIGEVSSDFGQIQIFDPYCEDGDDSLINDSDIEKYAWNLPGGIGIALGVIETGVHQVEILVSKEVPEHDLSEWDHVVEIPLRASEKEIEIEDQEIRVPTVNVVIRWCLRKVSDQHEYAIFIYSARKKDIEVLKQHEWT